jgi:hypothetical protein
VVTNVDTETAKVIDLAPYTREDFLGDMDRFTHSRYDQELGRTLVEESNEAIKWLAGLGLGFQLSFNRQVYDIIGFTPEQRADENRHIKLMGGINCLVDLR